MFSISYRPILAWLLYLLSCHSNRHPICCFAICGRLQLLLHVYYHFIACTPAAMQSRYCFILASVRVLVSLFVPLCVRLHKN